MSQKDIDPATVNPLTLSFIFRDVSCTVPANRPLTLWLRYMLDNFPDDLQFLYKESQLYTRHGGGSKYTFDRWKVRLNNNLNKTLEEQNLGK